MKKIITFLGVLFFLLAGWLSALQAQTTCYTVWQDNSAGTLNLYNNIVYGNSSGLPSSVTVSTAYSGAMASNVVDVPPGFTSDASYLITTGSTPTYNAGTSSYASPNATDIQGYARIQGTSVDIGAYEVGTAVLCTVSIPAITNGSVSVMNGTTPVLNGTIMNSGTSLTITATPNPGYTFNNIAVNGSVSATNPYSFTITGPTTISATFSTNVAAVYEAAGNLNLYNNIVYGNTGIALATYASVSKDLTGNTTNVVDVPPGFTSAANYLITTGSTATYNAGISSYTSPYTTDIQGYARIQGTSVDIGAYEVGTAVLCTVSIPAITNGSVSVMNGTTPVLNGTSVNSGTSLTVTVTPNPGYTFKSIAVNGSVSNTNPYTFIVDGSTTISATFSTNVAAVYEANGSLNLYNNIVYGNTGIALATYESVSKDLTGNTTNVVDVPPGFTSAASYLITTGSTATYNTGTSSYASPYTTDIQGYARIQGTSVDMGAYEAGTAVLCTVSIPAITNGSISVMNGTTPVLNGSIMNSGTSLTITATPNPGYTFKSIAVNGSVSVTNSYTFTVNGPTTISATFSTNVAAVYEAAGSLNLYNNIVYGNTGIALATYTSVSKDLTGNTTNVVDVPPGFTSAASYLITTGSTATYNTGTSSYASPYTTDIQGYARIQGTSVDIGAYEAGTAVLCTVSIPAITNGSISVMNGTTPVLNGAIMNSGTSLTITATPNPGYTFKSITVNGSVYATNPYTFTVTGPTTISATFSTNVAAVYEAAGSLNLYNNIVYGNTGIALATYASVSKDLTGNTTNVVDVSPGFTSAASYLITTGSTATYNTGTSSYTNPNFTDIQGYARIQGTSVDIGAYEVGTAGIVTGVDTEKDQNLTVYSNSNKQIVVLYIPVTTKSATVSVYNAMGQQLVSGKLTATTTILDGLFVPGVYVVKVNNSTRKVIVR